MCKTQCLLTLVALSVGLTHSWDIAVGVEDQVIFYADGHVNNTVNLHNRNITALAYDEVHNIMLYVDKQDAICSFNLYTEEHKCFINFHNNSIHSIAFDPVTQKLFFTDIDNNSINWISLKSGSDDNVHVNIRLDDRTPTDIAVDSCRGYIYWTNTNNNNHFNESLERARFNGSGREIIARKYKIYGVLTLDIDPLTRKMYYFDGYKYGGLYKHEYLNHADVNGGAEQIMYKYNYNEYGQYTAAKELTVSKDYLYWVYRNESYETVWQLPKNASYAKEPEKISTFYSGKSIVIATNYKIEDRIRGLQDCESLPLITVTDISLNTESTTAYTSEYSTVIQTDHTIEYTPQYTPQHTTEYTTEHPTEYSTENTTDVDLFCFHGVHVPETPICTCTPGYVGLRCEISVCHNYCLNGNCSLNDEGLPTCRCNAGYFGDRCEVYACFGYCINDGNCFLNEKDEPVCQCAGNHEGSRCEAVKDVTFTINNTPTYYSAERNLTLADLLANWRKPSAKVTVTVEV